VEPGRARYKRVADDLRAAIRRGAYAPNQQLPSQPQLAQEYGLTQGMIGRAMAILAAEGLIRLEHGKGAFVLAVPAAKRTRVIDRDYRTNPGGSSFAEEQRQAGRQSRAPLVQAGEIVPPPDIAEHLRLGDGETVLIRDRRMWSGDAPVQIATSYIPMTYAGSTDLAHPDTGPSGIYARLAGRGFGPVRFTEDIEVRGATHDEAKFLRIAAGEPVFQILRTAIDDNGHRVEACVNIMAAGQWHLTYGWRQDPT
jgi:GntR family transcriptional regulator